MLAVGLDSSDQDRRDLERVGSAVRAAKERGNRGRSARRSDSSKKGGSTTESNGSGLTSGFRGAWLWGDGRGGFRTRISPRALSTLFEQPGSSGVAGFVIRFAAGVNNQVETNVGQPRS